MIGKVIYNILTNDSDVSAIISTKVYNSLAVEDVAYPYVVYELSGREFDDTKDGKSELDTLDYNIEIYSETLNEVNDLALKIRNALDRYSGTNSGLVIQSVHFTAEDVGYSDVDRVYLKMQNYSFRYETIYSTLGRPTNLAIATTSTTQLDLTWTDNASGESGYEVWRSSAVESGYTLITTTAANATSYSDTGLSADTQYYYRIRATDGTYGGQWSLIVGGRTDNSGASPSGIAYDRPDLTGALTSYRTGDDAWNLANSIYDYTHPTYPSSFAQLDNSALVPFETLVSDNAFGGGDKSRFTDDAGGQTYSNSYAIDHLTGLGWLFVLQGAESWDDAIDGAASATDLTFSDWRLPNNNEWMSISKHGEITATLNYSPFNLSGSVTFWSSTTRAGVTTEAYRFEAASGFLRNQIKTNTSRNSWLVRNHYT